MEFAISQPKKGQITTKRKANISNELQASNVSNGFDLGNDLDLWIFKVKCDLYLWPHAWCWPGERIYHIVTGVTSDAGVPSTRLVVNYLGKINVNTTSKKWLRLPTVSGHSSTACHYEKANIKIDLILYSTKLIWRVSVDTAEDWPDSILHQTHMEGVSGHSSMACHYEKANIKIYLILYCTKLIWRVSVTTAAWHVIMRRPTLRFTWFYTAPNSYGGCQWPQQHGMSLWEGQH